MHTHKGTAVCVLTGAQLKVIKACSKEELHGLGLQPPPVPELCLHSIGENQPLAARLEAVQVRGRVRAARSPLPAQSLAAPLVGAFCSATQLSKKQHLHWAASLVSCPSKTFKPMLHVWACSPSLVPLSTTSAPVTTSMCSSSGRCRRYSQLQLAS